MPNETRRVYLDSGPNTSPTRLTFEVTRTPIDEQPEQFGRPRAGDYSYEVELISGDAEALSDLDNEEAEAEAIRLAEAEWAEVEKHSARCTDCQNHQRASK